MKWWLYFIVLKCDIIIGKGKGNVDLYSASSQMPLTHSDMERTVLPSNKKISAFTRKHSPRGATTHTCVAKVWIQLTTHLSTPRGWMAELAMSPDIQRTVYPKEVTRQLHIIAQVRESSPVIDWCSNHCATHQPILKCDIIKSYTRIYKKIQNT